MNETLKQDLSSLRLDEEPEPSRRGRWILLVVLLVAAGGGAWWWRSSTMAPVVVETATPAVERIAPGDNGAPVLTASGYVVARRKAVVSAKIQGRLASLRVEEGSRVKEGDIIARLESDDYDAQVRRAGAQVSQAEAQTRQAEAQIGSARAQVARAQADLAEARRQLGVNERLSAERILPADTLDASRSRVRVLEAQLGQTEADALRVDAARLQAGAARQQADAELRFSQATLANTVIRAPFTGTVVKKMAEVGESVAPIPPGVNLSTSSGAIVALADLDTLEVEVDVAEANVAKLTPAQPVEVSVEAFPDRKYKAQVRQIIPTADRTKATVMVKVTILDKDERLKPEMSAKATFLEPARPAASAPAPPTVLVPAQAVITRDGASQVLTLVDGIARAVPVTLGPSRQDRVVIAQGLSGTETVIVNPPAGLAAGTRATSRR